ncbi:hypothetical protein KFL_011260030 [Klebsormidium nitens]|uniref:DNA primase/polymerase bifunctional N-terminal domain-containing protein n=1 Tax=Klebsormidium nitens TaxID=105231 RepID=A0A1Y1IQ20_KLENI|nr:hypothetical protein KFL_011260030 [Klebsormidium nitens]|eukprot:GAQ92763.1 hypothetical protein KFL_011260030 [Klebsormidium nitens]
MILKNQKSKRSEKRSAAPIVLRPQRETAGGCSWARYEADDAPAVRLIAGRPQSSVDLLSCSSSGRGSSAQEQARSAVRQREPAKISDTRFLVARVAAAALLRLHQGHIDRHVHLGACSCGTRVELRSLRRRHQGHIDCHTPGSVAGGESDPSDMGAAEPLQVETHFLLQSSDGAMAERQEGASMSHAPCEASSNQERYRPTSPSYSKQRTGDEILAVQAASDKRRRTGDPSTFREGFFEPGHCRAAEDPLESPELHARVDSSLMSHEVEGDRARGELQVERPGSSAATCASGNGASGGIPSDIAEEEGGPGNNLLASEGSRASSVESNSNSSTSCDSAPFTIIMAADRFRELGYPVFSVDITWDPEKGKKDPKKAGADQEKGGADQEKGGKSVKFPPSWQTTTLASGTVRQSHNSLAINTSNCDVLGLDIDRHDSGLATWEALQRAHGLAEAPSVQTGSGGLHLYYSRSKSIEAGLSSGLVKSFSKLYCEDPESGKVLKVGIDMRGEKGCLIAPGSCYLDGAGTRLCYEMIEKPELPPVTELPPFPGWLIEILNRQASLRAIWNKQEREERRAGGVRGGDLPEPASASIEPDLASPELQKEVVSALEKLLLTWGDNTSVFSGAKPSSTGVGVIYDFRNGPGGRVACPYFATQRGGVHDSNNFALLRRGAEILYLCYGESCKTTSRSRSIRLGMLPLPIAAAFGDSQPLNSERKHLYSDRVLLPLSFLRENLSVMKGDVGCAIILERLYFQSGLKFAFTPAGPYYWTGRFWAKD